MSKWSPVAPSPESAAPLARRRWRRAGRWQAFLAMVAGGLLIAAALTPTSLFEVRSEPAPAMSPAAPVAAAATATPSLTNWLRDQAPTPGPGADDHRPRPGAAALPAPTPRATAMPPRTATVAAAQGRATTAARTRARAQSSRETARGSAMPLLPARLWPLSAASMDISQRFGCVPMLGGYYPVTAGCPGGAPAYHSGLDLAAPAGTPIYAAASGWVTAAGLDRPTGVANTRLVIQHDGENTGYATEYYHWQRAFVRAGDYVEAGQQIAEVGSVGFSTGPHLHFAVVDFASGEHLDPARWLPADSAGARYTGVQPGAPDLTFTAASVAIPDYADPAPAALPVAQVVPAAPTDAAGDAAPLAARPPAEASDAEIVAEAAVADPGATGASEIVSEPVTTTTVTTSAAPGTGTSPDTDSEGVRPAAADTDAEPAPTATASASYRPDLATVPLNPNVEPAAPTAAPVEDASNDGRQRRNSR